MRPERLFSPDMIRDGEGEIILMPRGKKEHGDINGAYALTACNNFPRAHKLLVAVAAELVHSEDETHKELTSEIISFLNQL
jgi:hypothetical protein